MYSVGVTGNFTAIHSLAGEFGAESLAHSHSYRLEWTFRVYRLDDQGFTLDISRLQSIRDRLFTDLNGKNLNKEPFFHDIQTSLENLCRYAAQQLTEDLNLSESDKGRIGGMKVRLWESDDAWAEYEADSFAEE